MTGTNLGGRVVLVTGGSAGIGRGIAKAVGLAGAEVAICGTNPDKLAAGAAALHEAIGRPVLPLCCDVSDEQAVADVFAATVAAYGRIDAVFANAGVIGKPTLPWKVTLENWRKVQAVNLEGAFLTLRAGARHLIEQGQGGSLVVVSSTSALHGSPADVAYATTKTGVLGMARSFAVALARHQVRVNVLMPGWTETDMIARGRENERFVEATIGRTPVRRWAHPDEYGAAAVYLADPAHTFHTGDTLVVDGGYTVF